MKVKPFDIYEIIENYVELFVVHERATKSSFAEGVENFGAANLVDGTLIITLLDFANIVAEA